MTENIQITSQSHKGKMERAEIVRNCSTFRKITMLPEVNKFTINLYGSKTAFAKETERACLQKTWVMHPYSSFRKYWLVSIILATIGNVVVIPMSVSFFTEEVHYNPTWISLNAVVDILFIMDLCLNFRTGFWSDENGIVVLDTETIKKDYIKTWFIPDFVAVIPVDYIILICEALGVHTNTTGITGARVVKLIKLTRLFSLVRLLRFSRLLRYAHYWEEGNGWDVGTIATFLQALHVVVVIILICHWSACFHFMVASIQDFPENSWVTREGLQNRTMAMQYTTCMFRSLCHMMTLNYGSRGVPNGVTDLWVDIISMMVGTVMYALVLARITAMVTNSRVSENVFKSKNDELCQYMRQYRVPADLRQRAIAHLANRYQGKWFDERDILMELNEPLRREIISFNCSNLVKNHPFFKDTNPVYRSELLHKLEFEYYQPGELIIRRGTVGDCMFFIERGEVQVDTPSSTQILSDGSFFGELCLVTDINRRQATVRAVTQCRVYSLSIINYEHVLSLFPEVRRGILTVAQQRLHKLSDLGTSSE